MRGIWIAFSVGLAVAASRANAQDIGYVEDFALAKDRAQALARLIPGTEDYYFYHCLHYQHTEQFEKVERLLGDWIKRHKHTDRIRQIQHRQALLTYDNNPQATLEYLRRQLKLRFDHQPEQLDERTNLPTRLDQDLISRSRLQELAFQGPGYGNVANALENGRTLDWLVESDLSPGRRRQLLELLRRPNYRNLTALIEADLKYRGSRGFGAFSIHKALLPKQLDELVERMPQLLNQTRFVQLYITKLHPTSDVDWRHNTKAQTAYLDRLWSFVNRLAPVHNSLKAHVLYHRLMLDRSLGKYDKQRFQQYIKLPRQASYVPREFLVLEPHRRWPADLSADFQSFTLLPPVGNDEPLVRNYLAHFFVNETTYKPYTTYINDIYLKHLFAETKIVHGLGDGQQWHAYLPPEKYRALRDRVDLDFAFTNKQAFALDEPVRLELLVKNVRSLMVKVYQINTVNFYRTQQKEINTDVNLDGLVPHHQTTYQLNESPFRQVRRRFDFPQISGRGVYVIDFIGNGRASRALIRKGRLQYIERGSVAGHALRVLDENLNLVKDATIWMAGREYAADDDGEILIPFSNQPERRPLVLQYKGFACLDYFDHSREHYELYAHFYVDRESLLAGRKAEVLIRPWLYLNGYHVALSVLENVRLELRSTDQDGISTTREVSDFTLSENRVATFTFQVPPRLATIQFTLKAKVDLLSQNKKQDLASQKAFVINQIDQSEHIDHPHFFRVGDQHYLELLGKTGQPRAGRPVEISLRHRDLEDEPVEFTLQTDRQGRIALGPLQDIGSVTAIGPGGKPATAWLLNDRWDYPQTIHAKEDEPIRLPFTDGDKVTRRNLSLLEFRGSVGDADFFLNQHIYTADWFHAASVEKGILTLRGLPRGDYDLLLKKWEGGRIHIQVAKGRSRHGYVFGEKRRLTLESTPPLQILRIDTDAGKDKTQIAIHLVNPNPDTRVHVFATRFQPAFRPFDLAHGARRPSAEEFSVPKCAYIAGRKLGDEYRYILERAGAKKFPGSMLNRPGLLLQPWSTRKTETAAQTAEGGERFAPSDDAGMGAGGGVGAEPWTPRPEVDFANLDFLAEPSVVLTNLQPDKDGVVRIDREKLGAHHEVHVLALDREQTVFRSVYLPLMESKPLDLRLAKGLDPAKTYSLKKKITLLQKGKEFSFAGASLDSPAKFEAYDSLSRVYGLFVTLTQDSHLAEFGFVLNWPKLKPAEKRTYYSKHACHELNFFLFKKDPKFFTEVVALHLKNKYDKAFLDRWLLGHDLEAYLAPWAHRQLNIVEKILLAQRKPKDRDYSEQQVKELLALSPPDMDRFNQLFDTAIRGRAMDVDNEYIAHEEWRDVGGPPDKDTPNVHGKGEQGGMIGGMEAGGMMGGMSPPRDDPFADDPPPIGAPKPGEPASGKDDDPFGAAEEKNGESQKRSHHLDDAAKREKVWQFYRRLDKVQEWAENDYYKRPFQEQNADLVTVNAFWRDYALHSGDGPFLSSQFAQASRNFTEMMFALVVLDLPFESPQHKIEFANAKRMFTPAGPVIAFHEEIQTAREAAEKTLLLVSQNFFRHSDRYQTIGGERRDKFVSDEFLVDVVYGCLVVLTNPTSSRQKVDVLLQIPAGAMPVLGGRKTHSAHLMLRPYHTQKLEYHYYFPAPGEYRHYPALAAKNEEVATRADPATLKVVRQLSRIDKSSWDYVSQFASSDEVLDFLRTQNIFQVALDRIAFRMNDKPFFERVIELLEKRHAYDHTLWSYSLLHNDATAARQFLQHADLFVSQCGAFLKSTLLSIDPTARKTYQHLEYLPLVNARAHALGRRRQILNQRMHRQYHQLLEILQYRRQLDDRDLLAVTYSMLLQDRIEEAIGFFGRIRRENLDSQLQYDYCAAHLDFFTPSPEGSPRQARRIAEKYAHYRVDAWRERFSEVLTQLDEIDGLAPRKNLPPGRTSAQTQLASTEPSLEFQIESKMVRLAYQNLRRVQVNYYEMDVELLFSRNPFVQQNARRFSLIRPNAGQQIDLPKDQHRYEFALPESFQNKNVLVEIRGGGKSKAQAYYSHSLQVQMMEQYGQIRVTRSDRPLSTAYVKVYAQMKDGGVRFYKDGYTDLRGRFDYTSRNTDEIDSVTKFAVLVLSTKHGAVVREAKPPSR